MLVMVFSSRLLLAGRMGPAEGRAAGVRLTTGGGGEGAVSISSVTGCGDDRLKNEKSLRKGNPIQESTGLPIQNNMILPVRAGWLYKLPVLSNTPFWLLLSSSYTPSGDKLCPTVIKRSQLSVHYHKKVFFSSKADTGY